MQQIVMTMIANKLRELETNQLVLLHGLVILISTRSTEQIAEVLGQFNKPWLVACFNEEVAPRLDALGDDELQTYCGMANSMIHAVMNERS